MKQLHLLAFDLGASNGRGTVGLFDGERLTLREVSRFENRFRNDGEAVLHWDMRRLLDNVKATFAQCKGLGLAPDCFGVDTWGVDYGLLDKQGALLDDPRAYRAARDADMEAAWAVVPKRTLFARTGIAAMNFNTVYQLFRRAQEHNAHLREAETLLLMPDLIGYLLTGVRRSEYTNVTTTNLYNVHTRAWDAESMEALGIPTRLFTEVDMPGTLRGTLSAATANELGMARVAYAAVGTHDTASAVAAIPGSGSFAFCSSGTWSLFGVETEEPVLGDEVYAANFSNEGTVQGRYCPLQNIMGLWLIQECRRDWQREGKKLDWNDIVYAAEQAEPFRSIIDPDHGAFFTAGGMVEKIRAYCRKTGQSVPEDVGQVARCVYESLALKYRHALETLERLKGGRIDQLNIVGGGIQNKLLNRFTADATGRTVVTGPVEGACAGNLLMQAVALGELSGVADVRAVIRRSFETETYAPKQTQAWQDAYGRLLANMRDAMI